MNTYLIPWNDQEECDILKISANNYEACQTKVMNYYVKKFDSDELAGCDNYNDFSFDFYQIVLWRTECCKNTKKD